MTLAKHGDTLEIDGAHAPCVSFAVMPTKPQAPQEPKAGPSIGRPLRPIGEDILHRARPTTPPTVENFRPRAVQAATQATVDRSGVAQRAKAIGVLRKAQEFMSTSNPPPNTDADVRRALELAGGRLGLTYREYRALVDADPELLDLERRVIADARRLWGTAPATPVAPVAVAAATEPAEAPAARLLERIFVPVDYTMASHHAVRLALELRQKHGAAVCLFHAAESTGSDDWLGGIGSPAVGGDWVAEAKGRLRRFLAHVAPDAGADIEVRSRVGLPIVTLCEEAHDWGATLVIATANVQRRFFRSPGERLLRELLLPVLIIPTDARH